MKKLITTYLSTLLCTSAFSFAETYVVEAYTMTFVPDVVNVQPGDVIRWEYVTGYPHDVTSGTKCMDDGYLFLDIPSVVLLNGQFQKMRHLRFHISAHFTVVAG